MSDKRYFTGDCVPEKLLVPRNVDKAPSFLGILVVHFGLDVKINPQAFTWEFQHCLPSEIPKKRNLGVIRNLQPTKCPDSKHRRSENWVTGKNPCDYFVIHATEQGDFNS